MVMRLIDQGRAAAHLAEILMVKFMRKNCATHPLSLAPGNAPDIAAKRNRLRILRNNAFCAHQLASFSQRSKRHELWKIRFADFDSRI